MRVTPLKTGASKTRQPGRRGAVRLCYCRRTGATDDAFVRGEAAAAAAAAAVAVAVAVVVDSRGLQADQPGPVCASCWCLCGERTASLSGADAPGLWAFRYYPAPRGAGRRVGAAGTHPWQTDPDRRSTGGDGAGVVLGGCRSLVYWDAALSLTQPMTRRRISVSQDQHR